MRNETTSFKKTLKKESDRLKKKCEIKTDFEVLWIPKTNSAKEGGWWEIQFTSILQISQLLLKLYVMSFLMQW